jgi:hypothetical protein
MRLPSSNSEKKAILIGLSFKDHEAEEDWAVTIRRRHLRAAKQSGASKREPMPLTTMADLGHHNKKRHIVRFFMQNETRERIRCGVTNHALEVFKSDFDRKTDDPLTTFNKYRAHIESSASAKYDRQDFEPEDGQTILVTIRDL